MVTLQKVHGSENSFFLLDETQLKQPLSTSQLAAFTKQVTNRQTGWLGGADGVLAITDAPGTAGKMTVVNTDGSLAKLCGNGLRTVARYLSEKTGQSAFKVHTDFADLAVAKQSPLASGVPAYSVEISPVSFAAADLPFANLGVDRIVDTVLPAIHPSLKFTAVAVPNPHLIAFVSKEELVSPDLERIGKMLNAKNPYFPEGVNVTFAEILGKDTLFARTYERGVGFTNACGTGMSATTLAFILTHPQEAAFECVNTVYNPGGMVKTMVHHDHGRYWIELIGNATVTATITVPDEALESGKLAQATFQPTGEQAAYEQFIDSLPHRDLADTLIEGA